MSDIRIKRNVFQLWVAMKSWYYTTIGDVQLKGWLHTSCQIHSENEIASKESYDYCLVNCCLCSFHILLNPSESIMAMKYVNKSTKTVEDATLWARYWSTERNKFFLMPMIRHKLHNWPCKRWTNWSKKVCHLSHK